MENYVRAICISSRLGTLVGLVRKGNQTTQFEAHGLLYARGAWNKASSVGSQPCMAEGRILRNVRVRMGGALDALAFIRALCLDVRVHECNIMSSWQEKVSLAFCLPVFLVGVRVLRG